MSEHESSQEQQDAAFRMKMPMVGETGYVQRSNGSIDNPGVWTIIRTGTGIGEAGISTVTLENSEGSTKTVDTDAYKDFQKQMEATEPTPESGELLHDEAAEAIGSVALLESGIDEPASAEAQALSNQDKMREMSEYSRAGRLNEALKEVSTEYGDLSPARLDRATTSLRKIETELEQDAINGRSLPVDSESKRLIEQTLKDIDEQREKVSYGLANHELTQKIQQTIGEIIGQRKAVLGKSV